MKHVYIAGPYRGPNSWQVEKNIRAAEELTMSVAEVGALPVCPHTMFRFFDGTLDDRFWLDGTMSLLDRCDAVILVDDWKRSTGSLAEKERAEELGLPVFFSIDDLHRWLAAKDG